MEINAINIILLGFLSGSVIGALIAWAFTYSYFKKKFKPFEKVRKLMRKP